MGQEGWSAQADSTPGSLEKDRFVEASAFACWTGSFLPIGIQEAELKQPTHLMEHAVQSTVAFFPFGDGTKPATSTARKDGRGKECFSSEKRDFPKVVLPSFVSSLGNQVVSSEAISL